MQKILYPNDAEWHDLCKRPVYELEALQDIVRGIFTQVEKKGDEALLDYTRKFDCQQADEISLPISALENASTKVSQDLKKAIDLAIGNIKRFHNSQREDVSPIDTMEGVTCWRESRAIERVGIYIPGGTAPLFSTVLMLAIPAKLAGCKEIVLCTPPNSQGEINSAILYAAYQCGITKVYSVGGAQAIAAMALGTSSVPKVDKIFGPGNQYVTEAKSYAQKYGVAIDMPAGPSEVLIIADESCIPAFVAADLLSQAEHGVDSQVMLLSDDEAIVEKVLVEVERQVKELPRCEIANKALLNSKAIVFNTINECVDFSNRYAPEHLILALPDPSSYISEIINAGSVFLGHYSCESTGDYASGTNHTLPTNGYAKSYSGASLDSFLKKITFQNITKEGLENIGTSIEVMASAEGLHAHKNAVSIRLKHDVLDEENNTKE